MCRFCFKAYSRSDRASKHEKSLCTFPGAKNHNYDAIGKANKCPLPPMICPGPHEFVKRIRSDAGKKRAHHTPRKPSMDKALKVFTKRSGSAYFNNNNQYEKRKLSGLKKEENQANSGNDPSQEPQGTSLSENNI